MAAGNSPSSYGAITKTFHWLTALLIFTVIPLGIIAHDMPFDTSEELARKAWLFSMHKTVGITIFIVALLRILWAISQPKPGLLNAENRIEAMAAETVHWLLYGSLLLVPLAGWIHHAATSGFAPIWWPFGQSLPFVPKDEGVAALFGGLHMVLERVLVVALFLHIAGALKHHFVDRDSTLRRMLPVHNDAPTPPPQHHSKTPVFAALGVWAVALIIGNSIGAFKSHAALVPATSELGEVASDWVVQEGDIAITVTQFGSQVTGAFADWTASIAFDPDVPDGRAGAVDVTISIPSLTLGSVTAQAMGADFFDAQTYPTARFQADIEHIVDGYAAVGSLTIRDQTMPVSMPFSLNIVEGKAQMNSSLTLNRLDFGIGANMPDESSLAFSVDVDISLTAQRQQASE